MSTTTLAFGDVAQKVLPCKGAEYTDTLIKQLSDGGAASPSAFQGLTDEQFFDRFSTHLQFTNEEIADLQEVRNYVDGAGTVGPECKHNGDACDPHENSCSPMRSARSDSSGSADLCLISFVKSMLPSRSTDYIETLIKKLSDDGISKPTHLLGRNKHYYCRCPEFNDKECGDVNQLREMVHRS